MASPTVGTAKVKILPDFAGFNQAYGAEMKKHFGNFASRQLAATGQDMTNAISKPLFGFFKDGLKVASDFYTTVGELSAIMAEKTGESYGKFAANQVTFMKDGQQVKDSFVSGLREIARESKFSVDEMGQASTALARTGVRSQQEMIDFLSISQRVAAANREELVATTEEMRTLSQVFNTGSGPGQISHIGDVITTVLTTSNMDLATFTEGMKRAAPVANALGLSLDDTASSIGVLGNVGFKGSTASTALKNAMIRLRSDIPNVTEVLNKYGIETEDAEGKSIPLVNVLEQMHDSGIDTSEAFKVFGQVAGPAMAALLTPSNIEKVKLMTGNMEEMQEVNERMYERMKETPEFKLAALSSNFEELKLTIVDTFFPAFSSGVDGVNEKLTGFIAMFQELPGPLQKFAIAASVALAAAGPLAIVFGKIGQSSKILRTALPNLAISGGNLLFAFAGKAELAAVALKSLGERALASGLASTGTALGGMKTSLGLISNAGAKGMRAISESLLTIATSGPLLTVAAAGVAALGYAWYKNVQSQEEISGMQDDFAKKSFDNLSRNITERKSLQEQMMESIQDDKDHLGKIIQTEDYQKVMKELDITNQELGAALGKGGADAIDMLAKIGTRVHETTRSFGEDINDDITEFMSWDLELGGTDLYTDMNDSIDRYSDATKKATLDLINNAGEYRDEIIGVLESYDKNAKANPTAENMLPYLFHGSASDVSADKLIKAYKVANGKLIEVAKDSKEATEFLAVGDNINPQGRYQAAYDYLTDSGLILSKQFGVMRDIMSSSAVDIKNLTVEQIQAQIMMSEEAQQAQAELTKNQNSLGIGANATGFEELSTSEREALPIMNALIASGQDLGQSLSYLQKMTGITVPRAIELSNLKLDQMKHYIDVARQSLPQLGSVMSTFTEENPPTMAKAIDSLSKKYLDFATAQSKMRQLLQFNGGEFTALYEELATLPADQQLQLVKNLEFTPDQLATLREQQTALITAKTTAGAEGVMGAAAAAAANNGAGVTLLDPISKAFSDLSKEINDSTMTPTISPQLDPAFVGYWNVVIAKIKSLDPITAHSNLANLEAGWSAPSGTGGIGNFGLASGGPVWPGLRTRVNELGREGFVDSAGRFSMLPNASSMRFNEYGTVIPAHMVGNRGGVTVVNHNNISGVTAQEVAEYQSSLTQAQVRRLGGGL